jgi:hypothetical protein
MKTKVAIEIGYRAGLPGDCEYPGIDQLISMFKPEAEKIVSLERNAQDREVVRDEVCDMGGDQIVELIQASCSAYFQEEIVDLVPWKGRQVCAPCQFGPLGTPPSEHNKALITNILAGR